MSTTLKEKLFGTEVEQLKRKAKKLYLQREAIFDQMDCGHSMAMFISSRYANAHREFEKVWARLRELDPTCPPLEPAE